MTDQDVFSQSVERPEPRMLLQCPTQWGFGIAQRFGSIRRSNKARSLDLSQLMLLRPAPDRRVGPDIEFPSLYLLNPLGYGFPRKSKG